MGITVTGWRNVRGSGTRRCNCGSWAKHWEKYSNQPWPSHCSVEGCDGPPLLGAHVRNSLVLGHKIVPMCQPCNALVGAFTLRGGLALVNANQSETCG